MKQNHRIHDVELARLPKHEGIYTHECCCIAVVLEKRVAEASQRRTGAEELNRRGSVIVQWFFPWQRDHLYSRIQYGMKAIPAGLSLTRLDLSDRVARARDLFPCQSLVLQLRRGHFSMLRGSMSVCSRLVVRQRKKASTNTRRLP